MLYKTVKYANNTTVYNVNMVMNTIDSLKLVNKSSVMEAKYLIILNVYVFLAFIKMKLESANNVLWIIVICVVQNNAYHA